MKSIYYINIIIGFSFFTLAGCADMPITKTNCWAKAGPTVTSSSKSARPDAVSGPRVDTSSLDVIPCH